MLEKFLDTRQRRQQHAIKRKQLGPTKRTINRTLLELSKQRRTVWVKEAVRMRSTKSAYKKSAGKFEGERSPGSYLVNMVV